MTTTKIQFISIQLLSKTKEKAINERTIISIKNIFFTKDWIYKKISIISFHNEHFMSPNHPNECIRYPKL